MGDWNLNLGTLGEQTLNRLAEMLDNSSCGWRQLASTVAEQPRFHCSELELTSCSLQVLSPRGSPGRFLLARLADRSCPLAFLLRCLKKMDHQEAVQYLTATVTERISITEQPQHQQISEGGRVVLTCRASGPAGLSYQWFRGKEEILGGTGNAPELVLCPLASVHQGHYICRVNHGENCIFSQWAQVRMARSAGSSPGCSSSLFPGSVSGLRIVRRPQSQVVSEGDTLFLECHVEANPPAQCQWYHNMEPMPQHKTHALRIPCVTTAHRGQYSCKVFNLYHETWIDPVQINIDRKPVSMVSFMQTNRAGAYLLHKVTIYDIDSSKDKQILWFKKVQIVMLHDGDVCLPYHTTATDKVALLIGNMNYRYHTQLRAPMADVHQLTNLLRQLDFKVVSLLDLNWQEMHSAVTEFLLLLDKGVYGLLYFAGHGYENYGNSFMVPIDVPASYTSEHCLCVQNVLKRMQERETGLNIFLLDMCRKRNPNDDVILQPGPLKVTANTVFGYATCVDAEAYEVKRDDLSNGIFINFLKQRVLEDEKVTVMLDRVAEDMGRCELTRGRQALELRSSLSERRALTDQIQNSDSPAASSARYLQWAIAHVLPESRNLQFDCGVKVQLGFAAEFSNIMIIYTRILEKPKDVVSCSAQLTDFSEDMDIDLKKSNQGSLVEAGSLLLTKENLPSPEVPSLYTRIRSLQRLKEELTFTACLHYRYSNMDEEVQERQIITVGKPLVSKLNLHEPRMPRSCSEYSSFDLHSFNRAESSLSADCPASETSSIGSASTTWSYYSQTTMGSATTGSLTADRRPNVPEETDAAEMLDCEAPQPLTASKSLPHGQVKDKNYKFSNMYNFHSH
ncbi:MALT paracaspase 2 [Diretmus argenteus]